jgi:hypothetical protein
MQSAIQVAQISLLATIVAGLAAAAVCAVILLIYYTWKIIK